MADFQFQKKKQLSLKDKSDKGCWDKEIIPLCEKINSRKEYYTTSSCSGRIILLISSDKKQEGLFLFRTHDVLSYPKFKKTLGEVSKKTKKPVYFKQEPCILHVACSDVESAQELVTKARFAGWKRSGIMATQKRCVVELMSTEHIEFPIINKGKILVGEKYLRLIVEEANKKLRRTRKKIKKLENLV